MQHFKFENLDNIADVAKELGCQPKLIEFVLDYPSTFYNQLCVPRKKHKKPRIVYEVKDSLKNIHKNILVSIAAKVDFPEYVQGFVSKRSIITNASLHLAQKKIRNLDIKDFFESIKIEKIIDVFRKLGCNEQVATIFARLCTLNECLVQGANTSPILANLVCIELDKDLFAIAENSGCSYSRYADDITFSGEIVPEKKPLSRCIKKHGFTLNPDKWKDQCRGKAQYVTGLTVFDEVMPRLPKQMKRRLRQTLHYAYKYNLTDHFQKSAIKIEDEYSMELEIRKIDGLIAFMYSVELEYAYRFDIIWQEILAKEGREPSRDPSKLLKKWQS